MKLKVLALSLSLLFVGSIATSTYAMTTDAVYKTVLVDDDNKTKAKSKKSKKSSECTSKEKSESCEKTCDGKKENSDKK